MWSIFNEGWRWQRAQFDNLIFRQTWHLLRSLSSTILLIVVTEAVSSHQEMFLKNSQNLQENICVKVSF